MSSTPAKSTWFSRRVFAVPFGHYEAGSDQEPPANEILIGRKGQRAYFIDLLMNMGRRGAYLVTGRRGAGKTSFVQHCISEYKAEVFGRYLRSGVGRAFFWDRLIVLFLFTAVILGGLLLSQLLDISVRAIVAADAGNRELLLWLFVLPIALLCVYPLLYAKDLLEVVVGAVQKEKSREHRRGRLIAVVVTFGFAALTWFVGPFGSPALGMSRLLVAIASIALLVQVFSYRAKPGHEESKSEAQDLEAGESWLRILQQKVSQRVRKIVEWLRPPRIVRRLSPHLLALLLAATYIYVGGDNFGISSPEQEYSANLGLGLLLTAASTAVRSLYQLRMKARQAEVKRIKGIGSSWYALAAVLAGLAGLLLLFSSFKPMTALIVTAVPISLFAFGVLRVGLLKTEKKVFQPRPLYALTAKAVVSVVVALQLVHPALSHWDRTGSRMDIDGWKDEVPKFLRQEVSLHQVRGDEGLFHGRDAHLSPRGRQSGGVRQELNWILVVLLTISLLYFLEYEWVVRPFLRQRIDPVFADKPAPWDDQEGHKEKVDRRRPQRSMASSTFPWMIYKSWLPVLVLSVNLGFDRLDHRRVVHAMLATLRDEYYRTFLSWSSALANLGRLVALLLILALATMVGAQLFSMPERSELMPKLTELREQSAINYEEVCDIFRGRQTGPSAVNLICSLPYGDRLFHILYFDLLTTRHDSAFQYPSNHLLFWFFPYEETDFPNLELEQLPLAQRQVLIERGLNFRVYHLLLFLTLLLAGKWALHRLPVLPYHETIRRLDSMLDSLSSHTSTSSTKVRWKLAQWLQGYFQDENVRQVQQDPIDPRTLEFAFLTILHDIQHTPLRLPGAKNQLISLPTPEITFVFDELDKLGTRMGPKEAAGGEKQEAEILDAARRRSVELHRLLANMKNLLSSAPARFIFVGGRNLHDEWLADQTARHPLLTNIFNAEVYLPSLVTDHDWGKGVQPRLHQQVESYLLRQCWRARVLYCRWIKARWVPSFGQSIREATPESFVPEEEEPDSHPKAPAKLNDLQMLNCELPSAPEVGGERSKEPNLEVDGGLALLEDFVYFLTYRSMGNPKRLKELLALFVRPVSRAVHDDVRWREEYDCRHVLAFGDVERFRVQLLADVYRHFAITFENRLVVRDDKLAISVFFLADYLFKFHRRAFSWSNLERVDELVDIHRAPDLREILEEIVERWSERFLHPIRNGMYAFRFRSDIAREIEYLSRQSAQEMAAFNFTLDESLALKSLYASNIERLESTTKPELQDLLAGMGELHEFDQEYEAARQQYRKAIRLLDVEFEQMVGGSGDDGQASLKSVFSGKPEGLGNARLYVTWGTARLRLMLQVGLTFEFTRNYERAIVEYRNGRTLARSLTLAMLGENEKWDAASMLRLSGEEPELPRDSRLHVLKNLNILFQPVFAEAWVTEKLTGGVDTSISVVEKEIWQLRTRLPFVQDFKLRLSEAPGNVRGSNFALIMAELHNKAGDLCFFKGRQLVSNEDLNDFREQLQSGVLRRNLEGYLLRAHYHYAMGLHELRRFMTHRRMSSKFKFNIWERKKDELWPTMTSSLPDFVFRSVGGTLNDLAETMLGRVSLYGLFYDLSNKPLSDASEEIEPGPKLGKSRMVADFGHWLTHADAAKKPIRIPLGSEHLEVGSLEGWLGEWREDLPKNTKNTKETEEREDTNQLLCFGETKGHDDRGRLMLSLHLSMVGAKYLERGGYLEDAATEMVEVSEMVAHYLWWGLSVRRLCDWYLADGSLKDAAERNVQAGHVEPRKDKFASLRLCEEEFSDKALHHIYWHYLYDMAVYSLRKADQLFGRSRRKEEIASTNYDRDYLLGKKIPPSVLTLACSLGLVALEIFGEEHQQKHLLKLVRKWTGCSISTESAREQLSIILERSLVRHSYPMINRLQGLKVLIDSEILTAFGKASATADKKDSIEEDQGGKDRILSHTKELLALEELFDAPMHFTPLHSGLTCALVAIFLDGKRGAGKTSKSQSKEGKGKSLEGEADEEMAPEVEEIWRAAQRRLNTSEEMYTMRRAYYEAISDLYYLFDDYNDRQIHFNIAMQMAGTELVSLLKGLLHGPEAEAFRETPALQPPHPLDDVAARQDIEEPSGPTLE